MSRRIRPSHPMIRLDSWTLWEWWVLATATGGLIGMGIVAVASAIASQFGTVSTVSLLHVVGALEGITLGLTQWLVLRRYIKHMGWWIIATGIGAMIAWLIGLKVIVVLTLIFFSDLTAQPMLSTLLEAAFFLGIWVGAVLGCAQWFVLRSHVRRAMIWVFANALAWGFGLLIALTGATLIKPGEVKLETALIGIATGGVTGFVIGAITGIALVWLLKPRLLRHH
jgi:hypothetical protein